MPAPLSIVIPTLNSADRLGETADALLTGVTSGLVREVVISDGGSSDATGKVAKELGAIFVEGPTGGGGQIARGVAAASAPWLLILHDDTHLSPDWAEASRKHISASPDLAGVFRLRFRASGLAPRIVEAGANLRTKLLGLPYGDQGLLVSRKLLDEVGGVPDVPLMEDVVLARALKGRIRALEATANTSASRYETDGWVRRVFRNLGILFRFQVLRHSPEKLKADYEK